MPSVWSFICDLDDSKTTFTMKLRLVWTYAYPSFTNREDIGSWECILHDEKLVSLKFWLSMLQFSVLAV
ncbi:hypothetical protein C2S52_017931 [Perilla frutescens var. hirtella]|nr:hypothetical protein C2S52_017931 [Perilla frutescens var. hirtella]